MNASEKAYKEKLKHFFSDDVLETNSVSELKEKLKRRQLLFPNAQVNDFIRANLKIDDVLKDRNVKTSLSKEEQKKILKDAPKNVGEEWERTSLAKSCRTPSIKKAALKSKKDNFISESQKIKMLEESDKNYHAIKSMLILLKGRKRGHEPVDFENNPIFNEIRNKNIGLSSQEYELIGEYKKYKNRIANRKRVKLVYAKRLELPEEELLKIKEKERVYKREYARKNKYKLNFKTKIRFHLLPEEEKKKIRKHRRKKEKAWRKSNKERSAENNARWREENRETIRERDRERYNSLPPNKKKKVLAKKKKWREANKEKIREYGKEYQKNNPDKFRNSTKKYRENNPDAVKAISKKYYEKNREAILEKRKQDRLLKKQNKNKGVKNVQNS